MSSEHMKPYFSKNTIDEDTGSKNEPGCSVQCKNPAFRKVVKLPDLFKRLDSFPMVVFNDKKNKEVNYDMMLTQSDGKFYEILYLENIELLANFVEVFHGLIEDKDFSRISFELCEYAYKCCKYGTTTAKYRDEIKKPIIECYFKNEADYDMKIIDIKDFCGSIDDLCLEILYDFRYRLFLFNGEQKFDKYGCYISNGSDSNRYDIFMIVMWLCPRVEKPRVEAHRRNTNGGGRSHRDKHHRSSYSSRDRGRYRGNREMEPLRFGV